MGQDSDFGLTVRECLTIPPLDAGTVAAGAAGLSRRLRWVHVVDHNDVESALMGGELVLTSGVTLGHDSGLQRAIFPIMRRRDVAALVIALGPYMDHVPQPMRDDAERFAIPLIALPWAVNFRDVTHALLTRLVQSSYAFLEGAERLNRDLLDIVMRRGGLAAVCARLAAQLGRGVAITDPAFQMLASRMLPRPDSAAKGARAGELFAGSGLSAAALAAVPALHRPAMQTQTLRHPDGRALATATPILAASRLTGWLLVDTGEGETHGFNTLAAEAAAMVAGLLITHGEELTRAGQRRAESLLLDGLYGSVAVTPEWAAALGLDRHAPSVVLVTAMEAAAPEAAVAVTLHLLNRQGLSGRVALRGAELVALVQGPRMAEFAPLLARALERAAMQPRIALSRPFADLAQAAAGYREAGQTLRLARVLYAERSVVSADETTALGVFLRGIEAAGPPGAAGPGAFPAVARLRSGERPASGGLVETLACFLEHDGNVSVAARALGVHRHTLLYRLERIVARLGTPLDARTRLELRLQLLAWRLAGTP